MKKKGKLRKNRQMNEIEIKKQKAKGIKKKK